MCRHWQLIVFAGLALLAGVTIGMQHRPRVEAGGEYVAIDTVTFGWTPHATYVKTRTTLHDPGELSAFPIEIGEWHGQDCDAAKAERTRVDLGADVLLLREYRRTAFSQPVVLLIMSGATLSSFHKPQDCYAYLGYEIHSDLVDTLTVTDASWIDRAGRQQPAELPPALPASARQALESEPYQGQIPVGRLIVSKRDSSGTIVERRVVLYTYVRELAVTSDQIGMIRVSALTPVSGSFQNTVGLLQGFTAEVLPLMFEPPEEARTVMASLAELGAGGYSVIVIAFVVPSALVAFALYLAAVSRSHGKEVETAPAKSGERDGDTLPDADPTQ